MTRKKKIPQPEVQKAPEPVFTCGECASATGFCIRGFDGRPVCCLCSHDRDMRYRFCSTKSCRRFEPSGLPLPTEFAFGFRERDDRSRQVVPLFEGPGSSHWALVPVKDFLPDRISWDGFPIISKNQ